MDSDIEDQMADPILELISRLEDEIQDPDEGIYFPTLCISVSFFIADILFFVIRDISPLFQRHSISRSRLHRLSRLRSRSPAQRKRLDHSSISRCIGIVSKRRYYRIRSVYQSQLQLYYAYMGIFLCVHDNLTDLLCNNFVS